MKKNFQLMPEDFENLLGWLSADREQAGGLYEEIRQGLIRYFHFHGCSDEAALADETMNRVAVKAADFSSDKKVEPVAFIYGFARNIYREYLSHRHKEIEFNPALNYRQSNYHDNFEMADARHRCLEDCLKKLPETDDNLVIRYYSDNKIAKVEKRREMAAELGLTTGTLHMKVYRIRNILKKCIHKCLNEK